MTTAKATVAVPRRDMHDREGADLRYCISLVNETVLHANFGIPDAIKGWPAIWMGIGKRQKEMQLNIWDSSVVNFKMGTSSCFPILVVRILRGDVKLAMPVLDRFRVICNKWRACPTV